MPIRPKELAVRQQVYLERIKAGYDVDWRKTQRSLRERVRRVLAALEIEGMRELSRTALNKVLVDLQRAQITVTSVGMADFSENLADLADYASLLELADLRKAASGLLLGAPDAGRALKAALDNPIQATGALLRPFVDTWPASDAARVAGVVRTGWAQGRTLSQMVREVVGSAKNNYKDGTLETSRRHASTVIHTATQHVANAARMATWEANSDQVEGYEWVSTLDRRTTQVCRSLDGQVFDLGQGPMPPIHPNCRSTTSAKLGAEWDFLDAGATRASAGAEGGEQVPATETFYTWLKKQPADFQNLAIGPQRGKLLRNGGLTSERFAALNLDRNFKPLTLDAMRAIEPAAFKQAGL